VTYEAVNLHGADIFHRRVVVHAKASTEAIDVKADTIDVRLTLIPDTWDSVLICDVQDIEVLRYLDGLNVADSKLLLEYRFHSSFDF
jgi:hypothetical protein